MPSAATDPSSLNHTPPEITALLADLLHAMGQPLTTLGGCHLFPLLAATERDHLASEMAEQVDHLTTLYRQLRSLIEALPSNPAHPRPRLPLHDALRHSMPEWQREARRRNITLTLDSPTPNTTISDRTECAIQTIVAGILATLPAGTTLRLITNDPHPILTLAIHPGEPAAETLVTEPGIALRVGHALLQLEGGSVVYNPQSTAVTVHLPDAPLIPC